MLNPYPDDRGPRRPSKRDPSGYQHRLSRPDEREYGQRTENEMLRVLNCSAVEETRKQFRGELQPRRDPESRTIYNSFTATYQSSSSGEEGVSVPRNHIREEPYRAPLSSAERNPPNRVRRVQFSEQLEIDTKQTPQTPTTPTIPILRTGARARQTAGAISTPGNDSCAAPRNDSKTIYASPRHLLRPNNRAADPHVRSNVPNPRDPTPRSSEKKLPEIARPRQHPSTRLNSHQKALSDPPVDQSRGPIFSPASRRASNNILESLERMERGKKDTYVPKDSVQTTRKQPQLPASSPFRPMQPPASEQRGRSELPISGENGGPAPRSTRLRRIQSADSTLSSHSTRKWVQKDEPLKAYAPRSDHWDAPDLYPDTWKHGGHDSPSGAEENQSSYLISKYTKNSSASIRDLSNGHRYNPASISRTGGPLRDGTNFLTPEQKQQPGVPREIQSEPWSKQGARGRRPTKSNGYAQLEDEMDMSLGTNHGTELVLLPGLPKQIEFGLDSEVVDGVQSSVSKKRRGLGKMLMRRSPAEPSMEKGPKVPFQRLPVVAISFDDDSADLKQSTDETDEASDSDLHLRTSKWNTFDIDSNSDEEHAKDFLIPSHRGEAQKKQRLVLMLVFLVFFCLAVGLPVYFKMVNQVGTIESDIIESSDCATGDIKTTTFSERYTIIRKYLEISPAGDVYKIDEANSPQRRALCWLSDFDENELDVNKGDIPALIQRYSLAVIYFSLINKDPSESTELIDSNFLSSAHECDWEVVLCGVTTKVTALLLADKNLSGTLPDEIGNLSYLSFLELSLNDLKGTIPTSISKLSKLEYFAMAFNALTGTVPAQLSLMTTLEFVNLRSSQIHGTIPSELGRLTALETLLLEGNWLSGTIPSSLGNLHSAQQFSFRSNYLSGKVPAELCELREESLSELEVDSWIDCECCTSRRP